MWGGSSTRGDGLYRTLPSRKYKSRRRILGAGVEDEDWIRPFAHYFNLLLCELILEYISWYQSDVTKVADASPQLVRRVSKSLHLGEIECFDLLHQALIESRLDFESQVNNIVDEENLRLSLQQRPVELLCEAALSCACFRGKHFFFLLDEYENLLVPAESRKHVHQTFEWAVLLQDWC